MELTERSNLDVLLDTLRADSMPHALANACALIADDFSSFALEVIENARGAVREAIETGARIECASKRPSGRGRPPKGIIFAYMPDADPKDIRMRAKAVLTAARIAGMVRFDEEAVEVANRSARAKLAALFTVDPLLYSIYVQQGKAHLTGPSAALLDIDGTAWTKSLKGHDASMRASGYVGANRSEHQYHATNAYLSEQDIAMAHVESIKLYND